jgi:hypothetical protein
MWFDRAVTFIPFHGTVFIICLGMIPFKKIFRALAILSVITGCVFESYGLPGDTYIKSGITLLAVLFLTGAIRIPKNSRGTPLERGNKIDRVRFILRQDN